MKSKPDGVSVTLMSELAKRAGLKYVSKSHMFDLKKAFAEKVRPIRRGDEARIVNWALAEERKARKSQSRPPASKAEALPKHPMVEAVAILRAHGVQSISLYRKTGIQAISFFQPR